MLHVWQVGTLPLLSLKKETEPNQGPGTWICHCHYSWGAPRFWLESSLPINLVHFPSLNFHQKGFSLFVGSEAPKSKQKRKNPSKGVTRTRHRVAGPHIAAAAATASSSSTQVTHQSPLSPPLSLLHQGKLFSLSVPRSRERSLILPLDLKVDFFFPPLEFVSSILPQIPGGAESLQPPVQWREWITETQSTCLFSEWVANECSPFCLGLLGLVLLIRRCCFSDVLVGIN